jgi:aerobic-type carbon monoxide dehydrogenase small subunit (CoxS/CutS family)
MQQIKINGALHNVDADPQMPLLWAIRDKQNSCFPSWGTARVSRRSKAHG